MQNQTNQELPTWVWVSFLGLFALGFLLDTPSAILERRRLLKRIKELEERNLK